MKISEKLSEIKRKEGELSRLVTFRTNLTKESFRESYAIREGITAEELTKAKESFEIINTTKFLELTSKIEALQKDIIESKNSINQRNITNGVDKKLLEIKYLRLELSRIMELTKNLEYYSKSIKIDYNDIIIKLEDRKSKLDAEVQFLNWTTEY